MANYTKQTWSGNELITAADLNRIETGISELVTDVTSLSSNKVNVTDTIAVAHGGTGATTAAAARSNLEAATYIIIDVNTWESIYNKLTVLNTGETAPIFIGNSGTAGTTTTSPAYMMFGVNHSYKGIITRTLKSPATFDYFFTDGNDVIRSGRFILANDGITHDTTNLYSIHFDGTSTPTWASMKELLLCIKDGTSVPFASTSSSSTNIITNGRMPAGGVFKGIVGRSGNNFDFLGLGSAGAALISFRVSLLSEEGEYPNITGFYRYTYTHSPDNNTIYNVTEEQIALLTSANKITIFIRPQRTMAWTGYNTSPTVTITSLTGTLHGVGGKLFDSSSNWLEVEGLTATATIRDVSTLKVEITYTPGFNNVTATATPAVFSGSCAFIINEPTS